MLTQLLCTP